MPIFVWPNGLGNFVYKIPCVSQNASRKHNGDVSTSEGYYQAGYYHRYRGVETVSSIYIWSENLVAESEAKDGGN